VSLYDCKGSHKHWNQLKAHTLGLPHNKQWDILARWSHSSCWR